MRNKAKKIQIATNSNSELQLVPPHPDLKEKINKEIEKNRKKGDFMSMMTIKHQKSVGLDDGLIYPGTLFPLGTTARVAQRMGLNKAPLRGTVRVIVVLVNFSDLAMTQTQAHFNDLFFSIGTIATGSVREYYRDVSNNLVDIVGEVVGPFTLSKSKSYYANGDSGIGNTLPNARTMAEEAVSLANASVDFSSYDNDGDGYIDAYVVIHAGAGAEVTGSTNDIWSHKWVLPSTFNADGKNIYAYLTIPEDCRLGVCAHELGHLLFGFPDLYDTDYSSEGIGNWCLMAGGSWNNGGLTPAHPSAWCKAQQGWVTVVNQTSNATVSVNDVKSSRKVYRLWKNGASGSEYFLVENRQKSGFDAHLPESGLLIWHIDDAIAENSNEAHYKVALMQADGSRNLELNINRGDKGDVYPGSSNNRTFNNISTPNSKSYAGSETCVAVTDISNTGALMTVKFAVKCKTTIKEISKEFTKELTKEFKELRKEVTKEFRKEVIKDIKEKESKKDFIPDKGTFKDKFEKEIFEKPFDNKNLDGKFADGKFGETFNPSSNANPIEQRLDNIENRLNNLEPFIENSLRPDLSMGAFQNEDDFGGELSGQSKQIFDTKNNDTH
jgi:immune inhibitor A